MGLRNPSRESKFSGANGKRERKNFPVQLTTSRIGNLTRLLCGLGVCLVQNVTCMFCAVIYSSGLLKGKSAVGTRAYFRGK